MGREGAEAAERELAGAREALHHLQHTVRAQHSELAAARRERAELAGALEEAILDHANTHRHVMRCPLCKGWMKQLAAWRARDEPDAAS